MWDFSFSLRIIHLSIINVKLIRQLVVEQVSFRPEIIGIISFSEPSLLGADVSFLQKLIQVLLLVLLNIILELFGLLLLVLFYLLFVSLVLCNHGVNSDQVHSHLFDRQIFVLYSIQKHLFIFFLPLFSFGL